jgi:hypothetical protein
MGRPLAADAITALLQRLLLNQRPAFLGEATALSARLH